MDNEIIISQISTAEYITRFRDVDKFIEFCKVCNNYNRLWSCPPFSGDFCCKVNNISAYDIATIIGVKINVDAKTRTKSTTVEERDLLIRDILLSVRQEFDNKLRLLEEQIQPSLLYYAGSCRMCAPGECNRIVGKLCRFPDKLRSTLEAVGFDMGRTTSELLGIEMKWCEGNKLPPYFTLVYGILSNDTIVDDIKNTLNPYSMI